MGGAYMEKLLCRPGILFFYHFYRTILSEIERENERNILHYCAIFCPYYVIFFFSPFSFFFSPFFLFFLLFSPFFLSFLFLFLLPHYFLSVPHYFLVFTALFSRDPGSRGSQTFSMYGQVRHCLAPQSTVFTDISSLW